MAENQPSVKQWGPLACTYTEAMRIWTVQKAEGVATKDRLAGLEKTLRSAWPVKVQPRYQCDRCEDIGGTFHHCPGLGRAICNRGVEHDAHTYLERCVCQRSERFTVSRRVEDVTAAGKTTRPGLHRIGS
jgi:hypothetical protein